MKYLSTFLLIFILIFSNLKAQWQKIGPEGGTATYITLNNKTLYASVSKMIYSSTDKGNSWKAHNTGLDDRDQILSILVFDNDIFVGTIQKILRSTDNGKNWEKKDLGIRDTNEVITDNTAIFVKSLVGSNNCIYATAKSILYKSTDKGDSWFKVMNTEDSSNIFASSLLVKDSNILVGGIGGMFFYSRNNGKDWYRSFPDSDAHQTEINTISIDDNILYIGNSVGTLFKSTDMGKSWNYTYSFNAPIKSIEIKGKNIFVGTYGMGVFLSTDNGLTWDSKNSGLVNKQINKITIFDNDIFIATNIGVFISSDDGDTWESRNTGISDIYIFDIGKSKNNLVIGTYSHGLYLSTNNGENWKVINKNNIAKIAMEGDTICAVVYFSKKLFISTNLGNDWVEKDSAILGRYITNIVLNNNNIFISTSDNDKDRPPGYLYLSTDNGSTWKNKYIGPISSISILNNKIYLGVDSSVFISTDNGDNWNLLSHFASNSIIHTIETNKEKFLIATFKGGAFISTDFGKNWEKINTGLPDSVTIETFVINGNNIFAGTNGDGIYLSTNNGKKWTEVNNGLDDKYIRKILIKDNYIFAGTNGGVYKAKLGDSGITDVIDNQIEKRNYLYSYPSYPLPAIDIVNALIYWDASIDIDKDKIDIIDIFGDKIGNKKDITINKQTPYSGILTWNCSAVPNGMYFILINHGTEKRAIKVLVNK